MWRKKFIRYQPVRSGTHAALRMGSARALACSGWRPRRPQSLLHSALRVRPRALRPVPPSNWVQASLASDSIVKELREKNIIRRYRVLLCFTVRYPPGPSSRRSPAEADRPRYFIPAISRNRREIKPLWLRNGVKNVQNGPNRRETICFRRHQETGASHRLSEFNFRLIFNFELGGTTLVGTTLVV
jgi:hypothetical protein